MRSSDVFLKSTVGDITSGRAATKCHLRSVIQTHSSHSKQTTVSERIGTFCHWCFTISPRTFRLLPKCVTPKTCRHFVPGLDVSPVTRHDFLLLDSAVLHHISYPRVHWRSITGPGLLSYRGEQPINHGGKGSLSVKGQCKQTFLCWWTNNTEWIVSG